MKIIQESTKTEAVYTDKEEFELDIKEAEAIGYQFKDLGNNVKEIQRCSDRAMMYLTGGRDKLIVKN